MAGKREKKREKKERTGAGEARAGGGVRSGGEAPGAGGAKPGSVRTDWLDELPTVAGEARAGGASDPIAGNASVTTERRQARRLVVLGGVFAGALSLCIIVPFVFREDDEAASETLSLIDVSASEVAALSWSSGGESGAVEYDNDTWKSTADPGAELDQQATEDVRRSRSSWAPKRKTAATTRSPRDRIASTPWQPQPWRSCWEQQPTAWPPTTCWPWAGTPSTAST